MTALYNGIITIEPDKHDGKATIRGTRLAVHDIFSYLAAGMTIEAILADFPMLTRADILVCFRYPTNKFQEQN